MRIKTIEFRYYKFLNNSEKPFGQIHFYYDDGDKVDTHNFDISEYQFKGMYYTYQKCADNIEVEYDEYLL